MDETELAGLRRDNANMRALLSDLRHARPLLLYGQAWIGDIENVLNGHRYEAVFPPETPGTRS